MEFRFSQVRFEISDFRGGQLDREAVEKTRTVDIIDFVKADVVDLMERLRRSLAQTGRAKAAKSHKPARKTVAQKRRPRAA